MIAPLAALLALVAATTPIEKPELVLWHAYRGDERIDPNRQENFASFV